MTLVLLIDIYSCNIEVNDFLLDAEHVFILQEIWICGQVGLCYITLT
jgi:hypothetical protein